MDALALRDLSFAYPDGTRAVQNVSLTVGEGEALVLCGASGSGKTTLLRCLKPALRPHGTQSGTITCFGEPLDALGLRRESEEIGLVRQHPDEQLVTDRVWTELAFGAENLGLAREEIRGRVTETAAFFGLEPIFRREVASLSGGQKQLVNLASVLVLRPRILLLDEPCAQLDPIAADEFYRTLRRVRDELGTTILLSAHRLERAAGLADRVAVLERGMLAALGTPREVGEALRAQRMGEAMGAATRLWAGLDAPPPCPLTVAEGRAFLRDYLSAHPQLTPLPPEETARSESVLRAKELWFGFDGVDVLRGLNVELCKGEILAILGGNGAGKTTLLRLLAGAMQPQRGAVERTGRIALLPQDPRILFTETDVRAELASSGAPDAEIAEMLARCGLQGMERQHPYDLSGGEQQRLALGKLLLGKPEVLLLDEPTKGLDAAYRRELAHWLDALCAQGLSILLVSHDVEFCAAHARRCALLFDGQIAEEGTPRAFFTHRRLDTTAAARMAHGLVPDAVTVEDILSALGAPRPEPPAPERPPQPRAQTAPETVAPVKRARLGTRTRLAIALDLLLIPLTLLLGWRLGNDAYYLTALAVLLEAMAPFFIAFEGRKPPARELVLIAVLCAIAVAGRAAFFMLQQFKPVLAIVVVAGAALGGEAGFLVGAVTMLVSNMLFGQGPWTPFQMFAMGMIGLFAGLLREVGVLKETRLSLCLYGAFAAVFLYGGLINPAAALLSTHTLSWKTLAAFYLTGLPMDLVQSAATVLFLWLAGEPMLEKLRRVRKKYGI